MGFTFFIYMCLIFFFSSSVLKSHRAIFTKIMKKVDFVKNEVKYETPVVKVVKVVVEKGYYVSENDGTGGAGQGGVD